MSYLIDEESLNCGKIHNDRSIVIKVKRMMYKLIEWGCRMLDRAIEKYQLMMVGNGFEGSVKDYMTKEILSADVSTTITEAAKKMAEKNVGFIIVLEKCKPVGLVTERNFLLKVLAENRDPNMTTLGDIMSTPLLSVDPDSDLLDAAKIMKEHNIRKLTVIRNDIVYGIITAMDITRHINDYVDHSIKDFIRHFDRSSPR